MTLTEALALHSPGRALDAEIARALGIVPSEAFQPCASPDPAVWGIGDYGFWHANHFSTSLDAAVALWREKRRGWDIRIQSSFNRDGDIWWRVKARDSFFEPEEGEPNPWSVEVHAPNEPAMAVIRALAAVLEQGV